MVETRCATSKQNMFMRICWKGKQRDSLVTDEMGFKGLGLWFGFVFRERYFLRVSPLEKLQRK